MAGHPWGGSEKRVCISFEQRVCTVQRWRLDAFADEIAGFVDPSQKDQQQVLETTGQRRSQRGEHGQKYQSKGGWRPGSGRMERLSMSTGAAGWIQEDLG